MKIKLVNFDRIKNKKIANVMQERHKIYRFLTKMSFYPLLFFNSMSMDSGVVQSSL